ncbi:hypothetical protein HFD88_008497 [Aspergillus terreus]|nr:hypothetical protein HFD88_008497 [Aspergillus terreus]
MSSPSTPRTTRSASPPGSSPDMLTPGRKIKAMLAAFDSDSDSDKGSPKPLKSSAALFGNAATKHARTEPIDAQENSSDDEEIVRPKGRMAARMQAEIHSSNTQSATQPESALERVSKTLHASTERADSASHKAGSSEEDDDDLPMAGPRRRIAGARNATPENDDSNNGAPRPRAFSPLFMSSPTAERPTAQTQESDASDEEARPKANARFLALVAQKRKEREEKERLEAEKKAERAKQREQLSSEILSGDEDSADEGAARRRLAKQARPPRKASKKALEEMNRETQRMSRNMQLAHQAQTKKKITKESLFARFNFMQPEQPQPQPADSSSVAADSQQSSDAEANKAKDTPQTSPVMGPEKQPHPGQDKGIDFPSLQEMVTASQEEPAEVTVARAEDRTNEPQPKPAAPKEKKALAGPSVRVRLSRQQVAQTQKNDSDDELEIVTSPAKCRRLAVFENHSHKRTQESQAMIQLKALAHITSPSRKTGMTAAELSANLLYQARQQAARERKERIAELRAQGMMVETAEERAAMEDELENLVEKARKEAEEIARKERKSKKGEDDDDEEDDDYEFSGSEEEANEDEDEEEEEREEGRHGEGNVFDSEADEADESEDDQSEAMSTTEEVQAQRRKRPIRVISDDEDEEQEQGQEPKTPAKTITPSVRSVERPVIPVSPANGMTMSLTQAFAGTLGGSPHDSPSTIPHSLPDPAGDVTDDRQEPDSQTIVKDSQDQRAEATDLLSVYPQSEARVSESPGPRTLSQFSQIPDPTQDAGFVFSPFDPSKRFLGTPTSTIETVLVDRTDSRNATPVPEKRAKRLRRGREAELSVIEEQEEGDFEIEASAFDVMKKAVKKPSIPFDKQKSKAKDIVDEAAEESDDEYAGLGGASDDEDDEENVYDQQMINDNSGETVDEKQLAALNALHQRNADEKQVAKLLKDITTGALRRRKGAGDDFDLDDSDDELLARRREKQREFARMRRALLADEKIGEIAENPKKAAFFKAIEDRDMDDDGDLDFLDYEEPTESQEASSQDVNTEPQQETTTEESNKRKRPLEPSTEDVNNRPPPHMRRKPASAMSKKPTTLAEIRETVSFLTERPEYDSFHEDASVDEDDQQGEDGALSGTPEREETPAPVHPRRTRGPVVDRLALLRQASSNSASSASNNRLAFHAGSRADASNIGFRPPPLVRRTTGSSSSSISSKSSDSSRRVSKPASGVSIAKKGAVNYYTAAREKEREREIRSKHRSGGSNINALLSKHASNRLGALGGKGEWD